jgi:hypothetical protein
MDSRDMEPDRGNLNFTDFWEGEVQVEETPETNLRKFPIVLRLS